MNDLSQLAVHSGSPEESALNKSISKILGESQKILSLRWLGPSLASKCACLTAESQDGMQRRYFLKCATGDAGKSMLEGEFHGMSEIYQTVPSLVPRPHGHGRFRHGKIDIHFLLSDFVEMEEGLPNAVALSTCIASLQHKSMSPTGKFGFFATTCHGKIPQHVARDSSWTSFFTKLLQDALQKDLEINGRTAVLEEISSRVLDRVIPRLLGALESAGRSSNPVLIHGDLWEGNIATEKATGKILLIDAAAYYAHGEMEIGMWRCERHAIHDEKFMNAYLEQIPKSEPTDEWDDRNRLYCVKMNVIHSAHHRGAKERKTAFEDMCYLVNKYAPYASHEFLPDGFHDTFLRAVEEAKSH